MSMRTRVTSNRGSKFCVRPVLCGRPSARKYCNMQRRAVASDPLLKVYNYDDLSDDATQKLIQRPRIDFKAILDTVRSSPIREV